MKPTLRARPIADFFVPIVIWSAITTIIGLHLMSKGVVNEAQVRNEVRHDLSSASEIYQKKRGESGGAAFLPFSGAFCGIVRIRCAFGGSRCISI